MQHFQNLTLKIQGQSHSSRSQSRYNTLSTHIPFVPCLGWGQSWKSQHGSNIQLTLSFNVNQQFHSWVMIFSKFELERKSHNGCNILSTHIPFIPCQSALSFLRYSIFKIWPWKSKVKVMGEVTVESHNMGPTFYRLIIPPNFRLIAEILKGLERKHHSGWTDGWTQWPTTIPIGPMGAEGKNHKFH